MSEYTNRADGSPMTLSDKVAYSIDVLKMFEPKDDPGGYYLCYSGGKDSDCIRIPAELAGVKYECKHSLTTVDAPETVRYIQQTIGRENIERPETTMWRLIEKKGMPPTRLVRYCCAVLKERGGDGRLKITGVRHDESVNRAENSELINIIGKPKSTAKLADEIGADYRISKKGSLVLNLDNSPTRQLVERCYRTTKSMINPIIDWTEADVWEFLHHYGCESNPLYQCGYKRVGCVGCPMAGGNGQKKAFERYPKYRANYVKAFDRMLIRNKERGNKTFEFWSTGEDVMRWWVGDNPLQITLDDLNDALFDAGETLSYWTD